MMYRLHLCSSTCHLAFRYRALLLMACRVWLGNLAPGLPRDVLGRALSSWGFAPTDFAVFHKDNGVATSAIAAFNDVETATRLITTLNGWSDPVLQGSCNQPLKLRWARGSGAEPSNAATSSPGGFFGGIIRLPGRPDQPPTASTRPPTPPVPCRPALVPTPPKYPPMKKEETPTPPNYPPPKREMEPSPPSYPPPKREMDPPPKVGMKLEGKRRRSVTPPWKKRGNVKREPSGLQVKSEPDSEDDDGAAYGVRSASAVPHKKYFRR